MLISSPQVAQVDSPGSLTSELSSVSGYEDYALARLTSGALVSFIHFPSYGTTSKWQVLFEEVLKNRKIDFLVLLILHKSSIDYVQLLQLSGPENKDRHFEAWERR